MRRRQHQERSCTRKMPRLCGESDESRVSDGFASVFRELYGSSQWGGLSRYSWWHVIQRDFRLWRERERERKKGHFDSTHPNIRVSICARSTTRRDPSTVLIYIRQTRALRLQTMGHVSPSNFHCYFFLVYIYVQLSLC